MLKIAVIGAGVTGLTVAHHLKNCADVTVFDKGRGVGGRTATRRADPFAFDHGAQYFVAKTQRFGSFLEPALREGVIARWDAEFTEIDAALVGNVTGKASMAKPKSKPKFKPKLQPKLLNSKAWSNDRPHFVGLPGMNALAKFLARDVNVRTGVLIHKLHQAQKTSSKEWELFDECHNSCGVFDWVIVTTPAEQAVQLIPTFFSHYDDVKNVTLLPCFAVMLGFNKPLTLPFEAALIRNSPVSWIAQNNSKPGRPDAFSLVIHSNNELAGQHVDGDYLNVQNTLIDEGSRITQSDLHEHDHVAMHRWLYANTVKHNNNKREPLIDTNNQIAAVGDWCASAKIESAFLNGAQLSDALIELI